MLSRVTREEKLENQMSIKHLDKMRGKQAHIGYYTYTPLVGFSALPLEKLFP